MCSLRPTSNTTHITALQLLSLAAAKPLNHCHNFCCLPIWLTCSKEVMDSKYYVSMAFIIHPSESLMIRLPHASVVRLLPT
ncbi:hypothetical protein F4604DRAFT_1780339 [Suillus subluteus]|nr:hypothetical protein F4604DRAFT_1780339 [Suillus subluteus]